MGSFFVDRGREVQRISQVRRQLYETYGPETESSVYAPVQTVVGDAVAIHEQVKWNAGVTIKVELGNVAAVVRLSKSILRQCVYNLVQCAIGASPSGSTITVHGAIEGKNFGLRVSDSGPGIPVNLRDSIFLPFVSTIPLQLSTDGMDWVCRWCGGHLMQRAAASWSSTPMAPGSAFVARIPLVDNPVHGVLA
ncbi:MAG: sensor histidine kinase [Gemmatimonadaceae bacterium]|nr:sensor histidine kinase [Gemmatimonadaceae bacterium]